MSSQQGANPWRNEKDAGSDASAKRRRFIDEAKQRSETKFAGIFPLMEYAERLGLRHFFSENVVRDWIERQPQEQTQGLKQLAQDDVLAGPVIKRLEFSAIPNKRVLFRICRIKVLPPTRGKNQVPQLDSFFPSLPDSPGNPDLDRENLQTVCN